MWPEGVSNPALLAHESDAQPTALPSPADHILIQEHHFRLPSIQNTNKCLYVYILQASNVFKKGQYFAMKVAF